MEPIAWETAAVQQMEQIHHKYRGRVEHARHVAALCFRLFAELQPFHRLAEEERLPLLYAAHLHDIGHFIHHKKHHRHSYYLILQDEHLDDWNADLRLWTALIALNHRKKKLLELEDLKRARYEKMLSCIAILRIADLLDCEHDQQTQIEQVEVSLADRLVKLQLSGFPLQKHRKQVQEKVRLAMETWEISLHMINGTESLLLEE